MKIKKKKLKKIIEKSLLNFKNKIDSQMLDASPKKSNLFNNLVFSHSSEEVKLKSRNMIYGLLSFRDHFSININDSIISLASDYGVKNNSTNHTTDLFSLEIIKDTGYILHFKNKRVSFVDPTIYQDVLEQAKHAFEGLNNENFKELYDKIMIESGLARQSNLEELFA
jgi:hypothetical protein